MRNSLLWMIALIGMGLIGCGKEKVESGKITLHFAHSITGGNEKTVIDGIVAEFEKIHPNIHIEQNAMSDDVYEDLGLISLFQGNTPPDIYFQWGGWLVERDVRENRAADLTEVLKERAWENEFTPAALKQTEVAGRRYLIPTAVNVTTLLWYNVALFNQLGLKIPQNWDELQEIFLRAKQSGQVPIALGNKQLWPLGNWAALMLSRFIGVEEYGKLFRLEAGTAFTHPKGIQVLQIIRNLAIQGCFLDGMIALENQEGQGYFRSGRALFHPIGDWVIPIWATEIPELEFDCINTPPFPDGIGDQSSVLGLIAGYLVYKQTPHFQEAVDFLRFYCSVEAQQRFVKGGTFSTIQKAFEIQPDPHLLKVKALFENAKTIVPPPDTGFDVTVADAFYSAVQAAVGGHLPPEAALKEADQQARRHQKK